MTYRSKGFRWFLAGCFAFCLNALLQGEPLLQYFNTGWREMARKMPELAEAGYESIWVPPPTKGSGGMSVGYDCWDRFDLGSKDQRGSTSTRYGTEEDLLELVRVAHRFGIRVYFDNIMNHNAFDVPGYNATTPISVYNGFLPEDFHLRVTEEGFYRKWDNTRNWGSEWEVMNLGLSDLIDIATEPGEWNHNFGAHEGAKMKKIKFVRQPENPEYYCYKPNGDHQTHSANQGEYVGFGTGNGITREIIANNPGFYSELVEDFLHRAARWLVDRTYCDGFRLDAVKHAPADFFGATWGNEKDTSDYGYTGQIQRQFNLTHGYLDNNHRDSVFDTERPRDDAMLFGEHLGSPPGYQGYIDAGMRLVDNDLRSQFNSRLGNPSQGLGGFDQPGWGGFPPEISVMHAQSHDNDYASRRELQHAFYFTRAGIPLVYTDGNYHAGILSQSGGAFPRHSNTAFLGQFGDNRLPNLANLHQNFARGYQMGRRSDDDFVAYERIDKRENPNMTDADGVTMLVLINDDYSSGQGRGVDTSFPSQAGTDGDAYLFQYARGPDGSGQVGFYTYASNLHQVVVPPGGYYIFSWRTPEVPSLWSRAGGVPITIYQDGEPAGVIPVKRKDGPDGDSGFNPYGMNDEVTDDYTYTTYLPRITSATNLRFTVRADGSAENILVKLDGGIDLNDRQPDGNTDPVKRDNPPAVSTDSFLGYEQPAFRHRQGPEKFAAEDSARCNLGSAGAETWLTTIGSGNILPEESGGNNATPVNTAAFLWHSPSAQVEDRDAGTRHYIEDDNGITFWTKANNGLDGYNVRVYYTIDGTNPEGGGGEGIGSTKAITLNYSHDAGGGSWFQGSLQPKPIGEIRYKVSIFRTTAGGNALSSVFPSGQGQISEKSGMMTVFEVHGFNATTVEFFPHNDYAKAADQATFLTETGLAEGFHILRARAFLKRDNRASLYNTFAQSFYYDSQRPSGEIVHPSQGDTLGGGNYGVVVRTDRTVHEVWYCIDDGAGPNDDDQTGASNGNGPGNWVRASEVNAASPTDGKHPLEWRFNYANIPSGNKPVQIHARLLEASSADRNSFTATVSSGDDVANWYTTLTRNVNANGPDTRLYIAWPPTTGTLVGEGYTMKAYFSKALAEGLNESQLLEEFLVRIASRTSGSPEGSEVQDRKEYAISWNETDDYHALSFPLPELYNGDPSFLHHLAVEHSRNGINLEAERLVKALPVRKTFLNITTPPAFDSDGKPYEIILPAVANPDLGQRQAPVRIETDLDIGHLELTWERGSGTFELIESRTTGSKINWDYLWSGVPEGKGRLRVDVRATEQGEILATARRLVTVRFLQLHPEVANDDDDDDDGLPDSDEVTLKNLPDSNPDDWTNAQVHVSRTFGRSNPLNPDSDGDLLPDALEVGWRGLAEESLGEPFTDSGYNNPGTDEKETLGAGNLKFDFVDADGDSLHDAGETSEPFQDDDADGVFDHGTIASRDTDGDGTKNFAPDHDPPFFNTVPDNSSIPGYQYSRSRTDVLQGSTTDPNNPDTDGDGLRDGIEDGYNPAWANGLEFDKLVHNGWVDGDGAPLDPSENNPHARGAWPNGRVDDGETWLETDPNNPDTDGDGLSDGHGEDEDLDGHITGDSNRDRSHDPGEEWTETDPLNRDTDGDGLLDGWEVANGLDPLDNGTDNLRTPDPVDGSANEKPGGDPDGDGFTNTQEQSSGTRPLIDDRIVNPVANSIRIGPGSEVARGLAINRNEFTDWTFDDLVALDEFEGDGSNKQDGDIFPAGDGFDSSRDIVAFHARDGGADGNYYFRLDFHDLKPFAEEGYLDIYVVIDTGNTASGEAALPDELDILTSMRWEVVVACYQSNNGRVFVDLDPVKNTNSANEDLSTTGVVARGRESAGGFGDAYFNSELDAVEFSISRQSLLDAGWNGSSKPRFQVFTTRDGTANSGSGAGDLGGRNDIRDSIYDDWLAEDYWSDQAHIAANGKLSSYMDVDDMGRYPDQRKRAKAILLVHSNHAILPGNEIHKLINTGHSTGYHRTLDAHEVFGVPFALHITPTLASAIQWAAVDPAANKPWLDGPAFNDRLSLLAQDGRASLLGTTFSDHIIQYFSDDFNRDNIALSRHFLDRIYHANPSTSVLWTPERVANGTAFSRIRSMGFSHTFIDQMRHFWKWQGRMAALSNDGYRLNRYHGVNCFLINEQASNYRYSNDNHGLPMALRRLYHRKARSATQDQVIVLYHHWDELQDWDNAAAYDASLRWVANKTWIQLVTPQQIANGEIDIDRDAQGDNWHAIDRGSPTLPTVSHDWLQHASGDDFSNWYNGLPGVEEGLRDKVFESRPDKAIPHAFGTQGAGDGKLADLTWKAVETIQKDDSPLQRLARGTVHAAMQLTAFHNQANNDLTKYSTGDYVWPDIDSQALSAFSKNLQSQARFAAIYQHVADWADDPPQQASSLALDVDLDGEDEYLLRNNRIFAVCEALGGRLVAAWVREPSNAAVHQVIGNFLSYSNSETEVEGRGSRTSAFKDWWAAGPDTDYVNALYTASETQGAAWTFTSPDGHIRKTLTIKDSATEIHAEYTLGAVIDRLYVRFGLSPNLEDLLINGQAHLSGLKDDGSRTELQNATFSETVTTAIRYNGEGLSGAKANLDAGEKVTDIFEPDTLPMRNQAQTHQVEVESTANTFTIALEMFSGNNDSDADGLPDAWENENGLAFDDDGTTNPENGPNGDPDGDGVNNLNEFLLGLNPGQGDAHTRPGISLHSNEDGTFKLSYPIITNRLYRLYWSPNLVDGWTPYQGILDTTGTSSSKDIQHDIDANSSLRSFFKLDISLP